MTKSEIRKIALFLIVGSLVLTAVILCVGMWMLNHKHDKLLIGYCKNAVAICQINAAGETADEIAAANELKLNEVKHFIRLANTIYVARRASSAYVSMIDDTTVFGTKTTKDQLYQEELRGALGMAYKSVSDERLMKPVHFGAGLNGLSDLIVAVLNDELESENLEYPGLPRSIYRFGRENPNSFKLTVQAICADFIIHNWPKGCNGSKRNIFTLKRRVLPWEGQ